MLLVCKCGEGGAGAGFSWGELSLLCFSCHQNCASFYCGAPRANESVLFWFSDDFLCFLRIFGVPIGAIFCIKRRMRKEHDNDYKPDSVLKAFTKNWRAKVMPDLFFEGPGSEQRAKAITFLPHTLPG